jgi:hypothetical protein
MPARAASLASIAPPYFWWLATSLSMISPEWSAVIPKLSRMSSKADTASAGPCLVARPNSTNCSVTSSAACPVRPRSLWTFSKAAETVLMSLTLRPAMPLIALAASRAASAVRPVSRWMSTCASSSSIAPCVASAKPALATPPIALKAVPAAPASFAKRVCLSPSPVSALVWTAVDFVRPASEASAVLRPGVSLSVRASSTARRAVSARAI